MLTHFSSMLFFAAAVQGLFLAGVLGLQHRNVKANQILALWIFILSLDLLQQIFYAESLYQQAPELITFVNFFPLTYGGFLFLYVRTLTQGTPLRKKDLLHFLLFVVMIIINIPIMTQPSAEKLQLLISIMASQPPLSIQISSLLMPLTASIYALASYNMLLKHPQGKSRYFGWLRTMLGLNLIIWVIVWSSIIAPEYLRHVNITLIYLLVSLVIYMLGYFSLRQPDFFLQKAMLETPQQEIQIKALAPKYGDNRLPHELRESIWTVLESYMQEQAPWRASNLTLQQFAERTGVASHHISQVLNDHHGWSFNDYLNRYRVKAVCDRLQSSSEENLLDIALTCGFSSKSSFNAIFKKHTNLTPSQYRKKSKLYRMDVQY